jgi:signal transduction histidine kinase
MRFRGRLWLWGLIFGFVGGLADTGLFLAMGVDFHVAGRNMTGWIAAYLALSFAALFGAIGWFIDARARARRDAETIRRQWEALEASRRSAAQNEKLAAIGRLAAGIAHEVRNPLGVIRASASMVQESFDPGEESHRACGFICEETDRLNGLITSLLDFARPAALRLQNVSLEKRVDRALALAAGDLERRNIVVTTEAGPGLTELRGDPDQLCQLLLDLVTNAAEALGDGGSIVVRSEADAERVRIEVTDDGPGVSLEEAERIFEPFYTTKDTGTGLGLAMTARIVHAHCGTIQVLQGRGAGPNGRGACFRIDLPRSGPDSEESSP